MAVTREGVLAALQPVRPDIAEVIPDRTMTRIEPVACPGLSRYGIYQVTHLSPYKPIVHYIGYAEGEPVFILSQDPDQFAAMVEGDGGVTLDNPESAAAFAVAFLTATRSLTKLTYLVGSVDELKFRPNLSPEEQSRRGGIESTYRELIQPASAETIEDGYAVTAFQVIEQRLLRLRLTISSSGKVSSEDDVIEDGLPLVYGGR